MNEDVVLEETQSESAEETIEEKMVVEDTENEDVSNPSSSDLDLFSPTEKKASGQGAPLKEDQTPSSNPEVLNPTNQDHPSIRASCLTKHDKRIIEKIRSYYEAAAKAEGDAEQAEGEPEDGGESGRRNSFSHIPSGLVKESVLRLDEFGHQGELMSEEIWSNFNETSDRKEGPPYHTDLLVANSSEDHTEADKTKCSQGSDPDTQLLDASEVIDTSVKAALVQNSLNNLEDEILESPSGVNQGPAEGLLEVNQEPQNRPLAPGCEDLPQLAKENVSSEETGASKNQDQILSNERERQQSCSTQPHRTTKELPVTQEEKCSKSGPKNQSSWVRKKPRDLTKTSRNVDSQWSHHSRIVSSNRALFESMRSDVASIGFFEATPEVDPVLIENSERILSKVQTLAHMFGAKAGSMKVPLHKNRGTTTQSPPWDKARWSGNQFHAHNLNKKHILTQSQQHNGKKLQESNSDSEAKRANEKSQSQGEAPEERKVQEQKTFLQSSSKFFRRWNYLLPFLVKICQEKKNPTLNES